MYAIKSNIKLRKCDAHHLVGIQAEQPDSSPTDDDDGRTETLAVAPRAQGPEANNIAPLRMHGYTRAAAVAQLEAARIH